MIALRPISADDADALFPLVAQSRILDTVLWDGPASLDELRRSLAHFAEETARGTSHHFAIVDGGRPIGSIGVRPENDFRGDLGLWVATADQGRGVGTEAVRLATRFAFERAGLAKLEAGVFVGNVASRRIFEKNGYTLEGTIRRAVKKRGQLVDEWLFGIVPEELPR